MANDAIPQNDAALLAAQAEAGMAGVNAYQAARNQLQGSKQQAVSGALASAEARGGPSGAMESALGDVQQVYAQRDSNLVASQAAYQDAQASRTQRNADYEGMVAGARTLIGDQAAQAVAPINADSEARIAAIRRQSEADTSTFQHEMEMQRLQMEAQAAAAARDAAARAAASRGRGGGGGGGGGGKALTANEFLGMALPGAANDVQQSQQVAAQVAQSTNDLAGAAGYIGGLQQSGGRTSFKRGEGKEMWEDYLALEGEVTRIKKLLSPDNRPGRYRPAGGSVAELREAEKAAEKARMGYTDAQLKYGETNSATAALEPQAGTPSVLGYMGAAPSGTDFQNQLAQAIAMQSSAGGNGWTGTFDTGYASDATWGMGLEADGLASGTASEAMLRAMAQQAGQLTEAGYEISPEVWGQALEDNQLKGKSVGDYLGERGGWGDLNQQRDFANDAEASRIAADEKLEQKWQDYEKDVIKFNEDSDAAAIEKAADDDARLDAEAERALDSAIGDLTGNAVSRQQMSKYSDAQLVTAVQQIAADEGVMFNDSVSFIQANYNGSSEPLDDNMLWTALTSPTAETGYQLHPIVARLALAAAGY